MLALRNGPSDLITEATLFLLSLPRQRNGLASTPRIRVQMLFQVPALAPLQHVFGVLWRAVTPN